MTTTVTTARRVQILIARELRIDLDRVALTAKIQTDLAADHIDCVGLALDIEEEFDVAITDEQLDQLVDGTVGDVVAMVDAALAPAAEAA